MQWLNGKLRGPKVIDYVSENNREYMLMSGLEGRHTDDLQADPEVYVTHMAACIKLLQSIDITDRPFDSGIDVRLNELQYFMQNGLASLDDWEATTNFSNAEALYEWLCQNKPAQDELVFSHGDLSANVFVDGSAYGFYDLGRAGVADKWLDIAFCVSNIRDFEESAKYEKLFFALLGVEPDYQKIEYFLLLDEMF